MTNKFVIRQVGSEMTTTFMQSPYTRPNYVRFYGRMRQALAFGAVMLVILSGCSRDYPALVGNAPQTVAESKPNATSCSCSTVTSVQTTSVTTIAVDTLAISPPRFTPNGGNLRFNTTIQLTTDTLPMQGVYEFSVDGGQNWQVGQQFQLRTGGILQTRFRIGNKTSRIRSVTFSIYFERMLVIGNSIMLHGPAPGLGWNNNNGMAASAPEKDFVHLLTDSLSQRNPQLRVQLQYGNNFELNFGKGSYSLDEFTPILQSFKPDLIVLRLGENVNDGDVVGRHFEEQFGQLVDRLAGYGQAVKLVTTTSVWYRPQTDAAICRVIGQKAYPLVDFGYMVGQSQYFASQYADSGVAAHPNDAGMQEIANQIWFKIK